MARAEIQPGGSASGFRPLSSMILRSCPSPTRLDSHADWQAGL